MEAKSARVSFWPAITFIVGITLGGFWTKKDIPSPLYKLNGVAQIVEEHYVDPVDHDKLFESALHGLFNDLDPYSIYLSKDEYHAFQEEQAGKFGGIGLSLEYDEVEACPKVIRTLKDSPAFQAGLLPDDRIIAINGKPTKEMRYELAIHAIRGATRTSVRLKILRAGTKPFEVNLVRAIITTKTVSYQMLDEPRKIGYLGISSFGEETVKEFDEAFHALQAQGMKALIIDLRYNYGGLLEACIELADRLLESGAIVHLREREGKIKTFEAKKKSGYLRFPLVVLVNENSASASEIFAGAMKDNQRGIVVGTRTFGKGLVQNIIDFKDGTAIKLTTARYFTPSGKNIQRDPGKKEYGIEPDVLVELTEDEKKDLTKHWLRETPYLKDPQLQKGLEILRDKLH